MDRADLERKMGIILSHVGEVALRSKSFQCYSAQSVNPPRLIPYPVSGVAGAGDFHLTSEPVLMLCTLFAQIDHQLQDDFCNLLAARLNDQNAHVVTLAILEIGRRDFLENLSKISVFRSMELQIRIWNAIDRRFALQPHLFAEQDVDLLDSRARSVSNMLEPYVSKPLKLTVAVSGDILRYGSDLYETVGQVIKRIGLIRYLRLKQELLEGENPEINTDKEDLTAKMGGLGFRPAIADSFREVDRRILAATSAFDFKGCMELLRTAFEEIMEDSAKQVSTRRPRPLPQGPRLNHFSPWREYLENEQVLTKDQGGMAQQLYNYLSNVGSHQLGAGPREARLSKNMVIELGLMVVDQVARV